MRRRVFPWIGIAILAIAGFFLYALETDQFGHKNAADCFSVTVAGNPERTLRAWTRNEKDYYLFLPSYAAASSLQFNTDRGASLELDGIQVREAFAFAAVDDGNPHTMRCSFRGKSYGGNLTVLHSANTATLFLDSRTDLDRKLYDDEGIGALDTEERVHVTLLNADGTRNYESEGHDRIAGRGNSTAFAVKKPYRLDLERKADLLGMGSAKKWILLANAYDSSNLRTKLILDLAGKTGPGWVPECRFVDLYLNGEYHGLYLLAEKAEFADNRLLNGEADGCLLLTDTRGADFETDAGMPFRIEHPSKTAGFRKAEIEEAMQEAEDNLIRGMMSGEGGDGFVFDLDSWARLYLIDEIFENQDAQTHSTYCYLRGITDGTEEKLVYAGPLWDYDLCWGNGYLGDTHMDLPETFYARRAWKHQNWKLPYYSTMTRCPSFDAKVRELYRETYLPLLEELVQSGIDGEYQNFADAIECNSVRWKWIFRHYRQPGSGEAIREMREFLEKRIGFLNSAWVDGTEYCLVQIQRNVALHTFYSVPKGTVFDLNRELRTDGPVVLTDMETGEYFDPDAPVLHDCYLILAGSDEPEE